MLRAPCWVLDEEMLTIRPQPAASMSGTMARAHRNGPLRLTRIIRSHISSVRSKSGQKPLMPALLTRIVMGPSSLRVRTAAPATASANETSTVQAIATPPDCTMVPAVLVAPSPLRSHTATAAPSRASCMAIARPIPLPPPVTTAVLPFGDTFVLPRSEKGRRARRAPQLRQQLFADQSGAMHRAAAVQRIGHHPVHRAGVVPHHQVSHSPFMPVYKLGLRRPFHQPPQQRLSFGQAHALNVRSGHPQHQRFAARTMAPDQRMGPFRLALIGRLFGSGLGIDRALQGFEAVDHLQRVQKSLLRFRQVVVSGVGVGELGLAAGGRQTVRAEQRGAVGPVTSGAVDMPEEGPFDVLGGQIRGAAVLPAVDCDLEDAFSAHLIELAQRARKRDLLAIVKTQLAQDDDAALFENFAQFRGRRPAQKCFEVHTNLGADARSQINGCDLHLSPSTLFQSKRPAPPITCKAWSSSPFGALVRRPQLLIPEPDYRESRRIVQSAD